MSQFKPETQELIDRIKKVDFSKFIYDKESIQECLYLHLKNLGLPEMPIKWCNSFLEGCTVGESAAESAAWSATRSAAWSAANSAARSASWSTAWSAARSATRSAAWSAAGSAAWSASWSAPWSAAWSASWSAVESAARSAALREYIKTEADFKYFNIWLPFLKAFESGLWIYWVTEKNIICVPRPVLSLKGDKLHNETGAAVNWNDTEKYYFLNGVKVTEEIVMTPAEKLNPELLIKETNAEVRREIIRKIGMDRILQKLEAKELDSWREYKLYRIESIDIEPVQILRMKCPSTEAIYSLRVPPEIIKAQEAIKWCNWGIGAETIGMNT